MKKLRNLLLMLLLGTGLLSACAAEGDMTTVSTHAPRLELQLRGESQITLEYGQEYVEQGAQAVYYGPDAQPHTVEEIAVCGQVAAELGTYTVTYTAQWAGLTEVLIRTVQVQDTTPPSILLTVDPDGYTLPGHTYQEEGYIATDLHDGDLTDKVERRTEGDTILYTVTDGAGNQAQVIRTLVFKDPVPPVLELKGDTQIYLVAGSSYTEPGYTAADNCDGDLTAQVTVSGIVDSYRAGTYTVTYAVSDAWGNRAETVRTVTVVPVNQPDPVEPEGKVIYLTFDDGPGPETERLLSILEKYNVKATFFVVKTGYEYLLPKITQAGHAIGAHTISHDYNKIYVSQEAYFQDLYGMQDIIYQWTGIKTTLMRFPGGSGNKGSEAVCQGIMTKLTQAVIDQGFQYFDWNVSSGDAGSAKTADQVYQNVINGIRGKEVALVLQHDLKSFSVDAVERIILWGLENGYSFQKLTPESPGFHQHVNN